MSNIVLEAEAREIVGKGASRRLRRLENKVPAIVYGGSKKPVTLNLAHNKVIKALENEAIFSSVLDLKIGGKTEHVILKDLQRHPFKPVVMHMDLQRVSAKDVLVKHIPLHFMNEETCKGVKQGGGVINHSMTQLEVRCKAKDLPEFIEVDMAAVELDQVLHLSDIQLPKGVELTVDLTDGSHNLPVVGVHKPRVVVEEEPVEAASAEVPVVGEEAETGEEAQAEEKGDNKSE